MNHQQGKQDMCCLASQIRIRPLHPSPQMSFHSSKNRLATIIITQQTFAQIDFAQIHHLLLTRLYLTLIEV